MDCGDRCNACRHGVCVCVHGCECAYGAHPTATLGEKPGPVEERWLNGMCNKDSSHT